MADMLSPRALNRATLARQLLLERSDMSVEAAVEQLIGLQGQVPLVPYFGLWSRIDGADAEAIGKLLEDRRLVRAVLMRGTVHLVSARDCEALFDLVQPVVERMTIGPKVQRQALASLDRQRFVTEALARLSEHPRTPAEIEAVLGPSWPDIPPPALARAANALLCLVQTPPRGIWGQGGVKRQITARQWLGPSARRPMDLSDLARRYLRAFGPASVKDVQTWSGLTRLASVVAELKDELVPFRSGSGEELFDLEDAPRPSEDVPAPVRLVAPFDNLILSHADRSRIMDEETRKRFFSAPNGLLPGALFVDGMIAGSWRIETVQKLMTLDVTLYRAVSRSVRVEIETEGRRLLGLVRHPDAEIRIGSPDRSA